MPTAGEIKTRFHRCVQDHVDAMLGPPWMTQQPDDPYRTSLPVVQRLAQHIRTLREDDQRLVAVAHAYTASAWGPDHFPAAGDLAQWLVHLGYPTSGIPQDPDEFVTAWLDAERRSVG
jgi:hypothetical protein